MHSDDLFISPHYLCSCPDSLSPFASLVDVVTPLFMLHIVSIHLLMKCIRPHLGFKSHTFHCLSVIMSPYLVYSPHLYWSSIFLSPFSAFFRVPKIHKRTFHLLKCLAGLIISCMLGVSLKCFKCHVIINCCCSPPSCQVSLYHSLSWSVLA